MAQRAELDVSSDSVKQLTVAVDALVKTLEKLAPAATKAEKGTQKFGDQTEKTEKKTKKGRAEVSKFQQSLTDMGNSAQLVTGPLGGVASRIAAIGRVAKSGHIFMVAFSVAATLITQGLISAGRSADQAELKMKSLEAQVAATGNAAGFTAEQLDQFSRNLAFATLDSHDGVTRLVSAMLTFDKVQGQTFTRAIRLTQDLGIALSQDPVSAAKTLGKVLQAPLENYKALNRIGIKFTETQVAALKEAQKNNDIQAQQAIILDEVAKKGEGVAKAQAETLSGDIDTFNQKWDLLAETLGERVLPSMRQLTQTGNDFLDFLQEAAETDAETSIRLFAQENKLLEGSLQDAVKVQEEYMNQLSALEAQYKAVIALREDDSFFPDVDPLIAENTVVENSKIILQYQELAGKLKIVNEAVSSLQKQQSKPVLEVKGQDELLQSLVAQRQTMEELNDIFIKTRDARDKEFRHFEIAEKTRAEILKKHPEYQEDIIEKIIEEKQAMSDLSEERRRANLLFQIQKGLQNQELQLAGELYQAQQLINDGLKENSKEYLKSQLAIEGQRRAIVAGFGPLSDEYEAIVESTEALFKYKSELLDIQNLDSIGLNAANGFRIATSDIITARIELQDKLRIINESEILDERKKLEAIAAVRREFSQQASESLGVDVTIDSNGNEEFISEMTANEIARNEALMELRTFAQENDLLQHEEYLRRKNEITEEYEAKAVQIAQKNYEATNEHKQRLRQIDLANGVAAGLQNLANVAGNNKKLAKMAKMAALFSASTSLIEALANAAALPYPANIPAYIDAGVRGTQLIQQASQLNEPAFQYGVVDLEGRGTGRSDQINARISAGESVMTQAATARHKETLQRMNAGLPIKVGGGGGGNYSYSPSIVINGDASENTISAIDERLRQYETRFNEMARGAAMEVITEEQQVGGSFDPI